VQNATARLIIGMRRSDHIMLVLREHHWLPIKERVKFKVACLVLQSLSGQKIAVSCLTVLGTLYDQLTFRLVWYHKHTAAMATDLLQPLDLVCGLFTGPTAQSRYHLQTVSTTAEATPFWEPWTWRSMTSDM